MSEIALGGCALNVELGHRPAEIFERRTRSTDQALVLVGRDAERGDLVVSRMNFLTKRFERQDVCVELRNTLENGHMELIHAACDVVAFGCERPRTGLELGARFLEPLHFGREGCGSLDEPGVRRAGVGGPAAQVVGGFAGFEEQPLGQSQTLVGRPLLAFEPGDRLTRFFLPAIEPVAFFFRLLPLAIQLISFLLQPRTLARQMLQLRVERDDRFLVLVIVGVERGDRGSMPEQSSSRRRQSLRPAAQAPDARHQPGREAL